MNKLNVLAPEWRRQNAEQCPGALLINLPWQDSTAQGGGEQDNKESEDGEGT